jgi:hypothetical protein
MLPEQEFRLLQQIVVLPSSEPVTASHWADFSADLAKALSTLTCGQYFILEQANQKGYVQFASQGDLGLRAETVSNAYLPADSQLDPAQLAALTALGWRPPTHAPGAPAAERPRSGSVNHHADFDAPLQFDAIAALAMRTLGEIFNVVGAGQLRYRAFDKRGGVLTIPVVGLPQLPALVARNAGSQRRNEPRQDSVGKPAKRARPADTPQSDAISALKESVLAAMREVCNKSDVAFDGDGDVGVWIEGQLIFVRALMPGPWVRIWIHILGVDDAPNLLLRMNELNARGGMRVRLQKDAVYAEHEIPADPLVTAVLVQTLGQFAIAIAGLGATLQQEFGGWLWPEGAVLDFTAH